MALPGDGGAPAGVNMAQITAMNQSAGRTPGGQMWLCGWIANLDHKQLLTPVGEIVPFFQKQMMPGAGIMKFLPVREGILAKILSEMRGDGFALADMAGDLSPEDLRAFMEARASGIETADAQNYAGMLGALSSQSNVAMSQAMMSSDRGIG